MNPITDTFTLPNTPEYHKHFWDHIKGIGGHSVYLEAGVGAAGGYKLPTTSETKYAQAIKEESLVRQLGTYIYSPNGSDTIKAKDIQDVALWVAENESIPIYDAIDDFTDITIGRHKLASILRMSDEFVRSMPYKLESYLIERLAKNFGKAEEQAFICGTGEDEPLGITADEGGADVGTEVGSITFDSLIDLYFSVDPEYRKKGAWIVNDATAVTLRKLKDGSGCHIWNHNSDTILGKPVYVSNYMPDADAGEKPVAFGDFSYYWLVERDLVSVTPLLEKFSLYGQIGYLAYEFLDGKLIRPDAVKVMKISDGE